MNSQIRYLAIVSEQPETLANFYSTYFKMRELGRSDDGDVAVTDGFYNISILKQRNDVRRNRHQPLRHHHRRHRCSRSADQRIRARTRKFAKKQADFSMATFASPIRAANP